MSRLPLCTLALCAAAAAQDPGPDAAAALLRGERERAVARIAEVADPALRARLQAALLPPAARPAAFLAVARTFADSPEADAAILAGAAQVLRAVDRGDAVPELGRFEGLTTEDDSDVPGHAAFAATVEGLWDALRDRTARDSHSEALRDARHLLRIATLSRWELAPARVAPDTLWRVPAPLGEDLLLRAFRTQPGARTFDEFAADREPDRVELLPAGSGRVSIPPLAPGAWIVELASARTPWHAMRVVEVSDLDAIALVERDQVAVLVERDGTPVAVTATVRRSGAAAASAAIDGAGLLRASRGDRTLELRGEDDGVAWIDLPASWWGERAKPRWQAHVMTDRPLYRPGETIRVRVVLRADEWRGQELDASVAVTPAVDRAIEVRAFCGGEHEQGFTARTDALGLATLDVPVPAEGVQGSARMRVLVPDGDDAAVVFDDWTCTVASFERPALVVAATGPSEVSRHGAVEVVAAATWASGGPAADVEVAARVDAWRSGWQSEFRTLRTDPDGRATLPIDVTHLGPGRVSVDLAFDSPDGRTEHVEHVFEVLEDDAPAAAIRSDDLTLRVEEPPVADERCWIEVRGPAETSVLIVAGRGADAETQVVVLDEDGEGRALVDARADEWPFLDVTAATRADRAVLRAPMHARAPRAPRIELPERVLPGAAVVCRVDVGAPDALVTVAVVDERIYTLAPDRTYDPATALRPDPDQPWWLRARTADPEDPLLLLAELLVDGRVPTLDDHSRVGDSSPGPGGPASPGSGGIDALRTDFRATALFDSVVTGADGVAELRFAMPDDLTTWRATIVGVERDGTAFLERRALATSKPLAAEPRLPRVLRAGDAIDLPVVVDRGVEAGGNVPQVAVAVSAEGLAVERGAAAVAVAPGRSATVTDRVAATAPGAATLSIDARAGAFGDRSLRAIQVAPDATRHALWTHARGAGALDINPAEGSAPEAGMELTVLGSAATVRRILAERLASYPHGCVEQTLSGLLPFFAEVRGARAHDRAGPTMDAAFRERLAAGLRRLRALQDGARGGFAWWPGEKADRGMTALVLHGLCVMREGGLDPATVGLDLDVDAALSGAAPPTAGAEGPTFESEELAAACLRWAPDHAGARAAVVAFVDREGALPPGLLARAGLALWAAGDIERARACLRRIGTARGAFGAAAFPGESPLAVQGLTIELAHRLANLRDADVDAAIDAVLGGSGSTYAHACTLAALALVQPLPPADGPIPVTVRAGDVERRIVLEPGADFRAVVHLPLAGEVHVAAEEAVPLRAQLRTEQSRRASDHPAWSAPLVVERGILRRTATGDLEPLGDDPPHVGERLTIRVRIASPEPVRYVVVECPLPAGITLPVEPRWIERFDDRVAFTASWIGPRYAPEIRFDVVATHAGRVVWPPTTASAMYATGCEGGSAGGWLEIAAARATTAPAAVAPCFGAEPVVLPRPVDRLPEPTPFERLAGDVDELWWDHSVRGVVGIEPIPDRARLDSVSARIDAFAAGGPPDVDALRRATDLLTGLPRRGDPGWPARGAARAPWRLELRERLEALQRSWALGVVRSCEVHAPCESVEERLEVATGAVGAWRDVEAREAAQARLLGAASTGAPRLQRIVLDGVEEDARTPALCAALLACTGSSDREVRESAVARLPLDALASMPPAALIELQFGWLDPGVVQLLAKTDAGRAELLRLCRGREFVDDNSERLLAELPDPLWGRLPFDALVVLAAAADDPDVVVDRFAESTTSDGDLCRALVHADTAELRAFLAEVLTRRGFAGLGGAAAGGNPVAAAWDRVLTAATRRDAAALDAIVDRLDRPVDEIESNALLLDGEALRDVALRALAGCAPPDVLARRAEDLRACDWEEVFRRIGPHGQAQLLGAVTAELPELPDPVDAEVCAALWDYGLRCDDLWSTVHALCRNEAGARFARQRAAAVADDDLRERVLDWVESDTEKWSDEPTERALHLLATEGPARTWTETDRAALDRALRLRGLR